MKEAFFAALIVLSGVSVIYQDELRNLFAEKYQDRVPIATWTNDTTIIKKCE